jgi:hypothetical protein
VLSAFLWIKANSDLLVILVSAIAILIVFVGERWFLSMEKKTEKN